MIPILEEFSLLETDCQMNTYKRVKQVLLNRGKPRGPFTVRRSVVARLFMFSKSDDRIPPEG